MQQPRSPLTVEQATDYAIALCNRAEYCRSEIVDRLMRRGLDADRANGVADALERERYIDDRRFAHAFVRQKFGLQKWARRKIEIELRRRHIDAEIIAEALEQIDPDDYQTTLIDTVKRKASKYRQPLDRASRMAIARYAIGRGFEPAAVFDAIKSL